MQNKKAFTFSNLFIKKFTKILKLEIQKKSHKIIFSSQIIVSCCIALLAATANCEEAKKEEKKEAEPQQESKNVEKRGLSSFGGSYGGSYGGGSYGGHDSSSFGSHGSSSDWAPSYGGHDSGHHEHHEHVKTITKIEKYPVPYEVIKKIPVTVEKKVRWERNFFKL